MRFANDGWQRGIGLLLAMAVATPVQGADLTPDTAPPRTPPVVLEGEAAAAPAADAADAADGLKLPPAVPLEQVPDLSPPVAATPSPEVLVPTPGDIPHGDATPQVSTQLRPADQEQLAVATEKREQEGVYFNVANEDIREIVKQISRLTGKNFILDDKVRGEITIISEQKLTVEEVYEAFLSALDVVGYTTVEGPAGLIKIVRHRDAIASPIPIYTEKTPYTDRFITRLVTLKNVNALDMANAIKGLVSREGNLFAYPSTNTLIITDSGTNIDRIIKLVQELDTEGPQEVLEIIPIEYANVTDIADKIRELFGEEKGGGRGRPAPRRGKQEPETEGLPPVSKVISDERTNSLIVLASKITIAKVKSLIRRLDTPLIGPEEGDIHVLYLKNAKASDIAEVLTGVTQAAKSAKDKAAQQKGKAAAVPREEFEGLLGSISSIKADDDTNSLIIQANAKDFRTLVDQIISKLDIPRRQVYIEALIMELAVRDSLDLGTGVLGGKTFNVSGNEIALFGNTFPFLGDITTQSGAGGATTGDPIAITAPFSDSAINFPKFFAAFIAQQQDTQLNILSTPNILTLDNAEARIKVGDTIPFKTGSALTTGGVATSNIQREDVALELNVTPQITEGNNVRMKIKQTVEDFSEASNPLEAEAGPATSVREVESEVVVPDQHTVVLGGLMQDKESKTETKVPLLGDIPILGYLFKGTQSAKRKVNLLIFLTPYIVREPQDFFVMMKRKIDQRNAFIDRHFGEGAKKRIRKTIQNHNEKLVDYQGPVPTAPYESYPPLEETPAEAPPPLSTTGPAPSVEPAYPVPEVEPAPGEPRIAPEPPIVERRERERVARRPKREPAVSEAPAARQPSPPPSESPPTPPAAEGQEYGSLPPDIDLAF